jgi:hypothetical protein
VILTTEAEPGNPEHHRDQLPLRYLHRSYDTEQLAFVPRNQMERVRENIHEVEDVLMNTLEGVNYALDPESGIFCMWRYNSGAFGSLYGNAIAVYRIPGGYMLQLDPEYSFAPDEMAVE